MKKLVKQADGTYAVQDATIADVLNPMVSLADPQSNALRTISYVAITALFNR
jgi:hypothetical protein